MQKTCNKCGKPHTPPGYLSGHGVCLSCKVSHNRNRRRAQAAAKPPRVTLADLATWQCRFCGGEFTPTAQKRRRSDRACAPCAQNDRKRWERRPDWVAPPVEAAKLRATRAKAFAKYYADPEKRQRAKVRARTRYLIRSGALVRQPCEVCCDPKVEAHHDDYAKPTEVRWLCRTHHREHHNAERAARLAIAA